MALCKGTNYCTQCWEKLTEEEKESNCLPLCDKCIENDVETFYKNNP